MKKSILVLISCALLGLTLASCASKPRATVQGHSAATGVEVPAESPNEK